MGSLISFYFFFYFISSILSFSSSSSSFFLIMRYLIRSFRNSDYDQVVRIFKDGIINVVDKSHPSRKHYEHYTEENMKFDMSRIEEHYMKNKRNHFFVAYPENEENKVIGCVGFNAVKAESSSGSQTVSGMEVLKKYNDEDGIEHVVLKSQPDFKREYNYIYDEDADTGELRRMSVDPDHRGNGVSHLLCEALENFAREQKYKYVTLSTSHNQRAAVQLYRKRAYKEYLYLEFGEKEDYTKVHFMRLEL